MQTSHSWSTFWSTFLLFLVDYLPSMAEFNFYKSCEQSQCPSSADADLITKKERKKKDENPLPNQKINIPLKNLLKSYQAHLHTKVTKKLTKKLTKKALNLIPVSVFRIGISSQTLIIPDKGLQGQDLLCTLCGPLFGSEKFLSVKKY